VTVKRAVLLLRPSSYYRADAFRTALERHGFEVRPKLDFQPTARDVLVMWNRRRTFDQMAQRFETAGARVIIAENGYMPDPRGPKSFALALDHHNGAGRWFVGDRPRFEIRDEPWRAGGDYVLVLPQRGIGPQGVAMPSGWLQGVQRRLKRITGRPIRVRNHPGTARTEPYDELARAHCAVVWSSGAGLKAIRFGTPTFYEFDRWIGRDAATRLAESLEACDRPDRTDLWRRVSWAQWTLDEVATGEAMDQLLHAEDRDLFRAR
jgi:hypothetical protein